MGKTIIGLALRLIMLIQEVNTMWSRALVEIMYNMDFYNHFKRMFIYFKLKRLVLSTSNN